MSQLPLSRARALGVACAALLGAAYVRGPAGARAPGRAAAVPGRPNAPAPNPNAPVTLATLWRVARTTAAGVEYMTTSDAAERDRVGPSRGAVAVAYVPATMIPGTSPLYRLVSPNGLDHMDSPVASERGYRRVGAVGFPWTGAAARARLPGLTQITRRHRGRDNALTSAGESLAGYTDAEPLALYGYRRYGRRNTAFATLAAGGVTIRSNRVAGCALWSWKWKGVEYVNVHDYGRQIQTSVGFSHDGIGVNPTEAGSRYSAGSLPPAARQGAPCVSVSTVDSGGPSPTQRTRAIPLEWEPELLGGGPANPVAWPRMTVGKDITLNYAGLGPVARYTTVVTVPVRYAAFGAEIPTVYLNGDLRELTLYDAAANTTRRLPTVCDRLDGVNPGSGYGGIIASSDDGTRAFGYYGVHVERGGSVTRPKAGFGFSRHHCSPVGNGNGPADSSTTKLRAFNQEGLAAGENRFTTYLMTGTRAEVRALMRRLYTMKAR